MSFQLIATGLDKTPKKNYDFRSTELHALIGCALVSSSVVFCFSEKSCLTQQCFKMLDDSPEKERQKRRGESQYTLKLKARQSTCQESAIFLLLWSCLYLNPRFLHLQSQNISTENIPSFSSLFRSPDVQLIFPTKHTTNAIGFARTMLPCHKWSWTGCMFDSANTVADSNHYRSLTMLSNHVENPFNAIENPNPGAFVPKQAPRHQAEVMNSAVVPGSQERNSRVVLVDVIAPTLIAV